jgi:NAD(P)-dependent dehydrogenase (short-subunit alcohol dehydrogenase family)
MTSSSTASVEAYKVAVPQAVGKAMMASGKPGSIILVASMSGSIVNYPQERSCFELGTPDVVLTTTEQPAVTGVRNGMGLHQFMSSLITAILLRLHSYPVGRGPWLSSYNASKAGVIQLGKSLAAEWAPSLLPMPASPPPTASQPTTTCCRSHGEGGHVAPSTMLS